MLISVITIWCQSSNHADAQLTKWALTTSLAKASNFVVFRIIFPHSVTRWLGFPAKLKIFRLISRSVLRL
ncbi:hypothetical protein Nepgr_004837 [Nepenthes gracilis]|uniref:Uncharacterized protein n=1 Tax=Nepenthes gracilis TaxID=150966 RepID=A0AAD3XFM4_NEPGR|nr:hypothetical protein Nepgr_004837 [Nepenthes gracilis]